MYAALLVEAIKGIEVENQATQFEETNARGNQAISSNEDRSQYMGWIIDDFPSTAEQVRQRVGSPFSTGVVTRIRSPSPCLRMREVRIIHDGYFCFKPIVLLCEERLCGESRPKHFQPSACFLHTDVWELPFAKCNLLSRGVPSLCTLDFVLRQWFSRSICQATTRPFVNHQGGTPFRI